MNEQRVADYAGNVHGWTQRIPAVIQHVLPSVVRPFVFICGVSVCPSATLPCIYWSEMSVFCRNSPNGTKVVVCFGDAPPTFDVLAPVWSNHVRYEVKYTPIFTKVREVSTRRGILLPFHQRRHWRIERRTEIPWAKKKNALIWRGSTTGPGQRRDYVHALSARGHNVSFTLPVVQGNHHWIARPYHKGGFLTRREIMHYKYVLSIQGNDVATNLKWLMAGNSVIVMPMPTLESWLMEGLLMPYVHYVPLDDPANVDDVLQWLNNHPAECLKIVRNAQAWIASLTEEAAQPYIDRLISAFQVYSEPDIPAD